MKITGIGSVSPYGTLAGVVTARPLQTGDRRAYLVEPFHPLDVVPGLKTRRLDRLSVWSLVAASLAIKDSGLDLEQVDRSRVAVVMATGLGCIELTETFFLSAAARGWSQTDPIVFPETLGNAPASHVARHLDLRGPNITVGSKGLAAECALLQAVSLIRNGQADLALVLAGDTITRTSYEWYVAAGGLIPSEGVMAMVLEPTALAHARGSEEVSEPRPQGSGHGPAAHQSGRKTRPAANAGPIWHGVGRVFQRSGILGTRHSYARFRAGHFASGTNLAAVVGRVLSGFPTDAAIRCVGGDNAREILGERATILPPDPVATGLGDTGALLQLGVALTDTPSGTPLLLLGASAYAGFAALLLEVS